MTAGAAEVEVRGGSLFPGVSTTTNPKYRNHFVAALTTHPPTPRTN